MGGGGHACMLLPRCLTPALILDHGWDDRLESGSSGAASSADADDASRNEVVVSLPELRVFLLDGDHQVMHPVWAPGARGGAASGRACYALCYRLSSRAAQLAPSPSVGELWP